MSMIPLLLASSLLGQGVDEPTSLPDLCQQFQAYDHNDDGVVELQELRPWTAAGEAGDRVLVLVEARLLEDLEGAPSLAPKLERLVQDLAAEGWQAAAVSVQLGATSLHQDGRFVLALREFLRAVARQGPLGGVLLVGRFPDAYLVRTCSWRRQEDLVVHQGTDQQRSYKNVPWVRRVPEDIAHRADLVLSDLDGHWEDLYVQPRTRLPVTKAVFPGGVPTHGGPSADVELSSLTYEDFFHISDGKLEVAKHPGEDGTPGSWTVTLFDHSGDHECSDTDRALPNVLAHPDLRVSRIDARGVALRPRPDILGADGQGLLDEAGQPRTVVFPEGTEPPHWRNSLWEPDPFLERRLLAEYLDRNHAYRTGAADIAWRPSSLAHGLGSGYGVMQRAAEHWDTGDKSLADIHGSPTLERVVEWLRHPAVLRTLRAHSDPWGSVFTKTDVAAIEAGLGGPAWSWTPNEHRLVPSLRAAAGGGKLDWFLLRTLYEYQAIAPQPAFYHHTGCHGISPPGATNRPYNHPSYGVRQGAESLLFFANGLALIGRAKVFYDEPRGFAEVLAQGGTFGDAWARYFDVESRAATWSKAGGDIGRKRSYFWSVLGDWSLRLTPSRPD